MKFNLLVILLISTQLSWGELSIKDAQVDKIAHTQRGLALLQKDHLTHIFSYTTFKNGSEHGPQSALSYFKKLQLNDNHSLAMRTLKDGKIASEKQFHFFMGTKGIKAKTVHDNFIFLAAITHNGDLKIALLDKHYNLRLSQTFSHLHALQIYDIFEHIDGSYSLALKIDNHTKRLTHFERGNGKQSLSIMRFSSLLHLEKKQNLGDVTLHETIEVLKDSNEIYYFFNQSAPLELTLYEHDFFNDTTTKQSFKLPQKCQLTTISTNDFKTFFMGANKDLWLKLNKKTQKVRDYELDKIHGATIQSIHQLSNNTILVSGTFLSPQGEKDIFIHNYSPYQSYLWGETFHTHFNDHTLGHSFHRGKISLTALLKERSGHEKILLFQIDPNGKTLR